MTDIEHVVDGCECQGKLCPECNHLLCVGMFGKCKANKDGLQHLCKPCGRARQKRYRQTDKTKETIKRYQQSDEARAASKRWRQSEKGQAYRQAEEVREKARNYARRKSQAEEGKEYYRRWSQTEKGKESVRAARERFRQSEKYMNAHRKHRIYETHRKHRISVILSADTLQWLDESIPGKQRSAYIEGLIQEDREKRERDTA